MKSLALILIVWLVAFYAVVSLKQHRDQNGGVPVVNSAAVQIPTWTLTPQCRVTSRNLPRYVERIA